MHTGDWNVWPTSASSSRFTMREGFFWLMIKWLCTRNQPPSFCSTTTCWANTAMSFKTGLDSTLAVSPLGPAKGLVFQTEGPCFWECWDLQRALGIAFQTEGCFFRNVVFLRAFYLIDEIASLLAWASPGFNGSKFLSCTICATSLKMRDGWIHQHAGAIQESIL